MVELVDTLALGASAIGVEVRVLFPVPLKLLYQKEYFFIKITNKND